MNRLFQGAALLVALSASSVAWAEEDLAGVDKVAPNFRLPLYNLEKTGPTAVGLDRFVGPDASDKQTRVVLLSFMASFCAPCKKEMPSLQALHEKYKDLRLRVMMVSIDGEIEGQQKIEELIKVNKVTFPILKDRFQLVARRWLGSKSPLPSVFFIRPDGTVSKVHRGYSEEASLILAADLESSLGIKNGSVLPAKVTATNSIP